MVVAAAAVVGEEEEEEAEKEVVAAAELAVRFLFRADLEEDLEEDICCVVFVDGLSCGMCLSLLSIQIFQ